MLEKLKGLFDRSIPETLVISRGAAEAYFLILTTIRRNRKGSGTYINIGNVEGVRDLIMKNKRVLRPLTPRLLRILNKLGRNNSGIDVKLSGNWMKKENTTVFFDKPSLIQLMGVYPTYPTNWFGMNTERRKDWWANHLLLVSDTMDMNRISNTISKLTLLLGETKSLGE